MTKEHSGEQAENVAIIKESEAGKAAVNEAIWLFCSAAAQPNRYDGRHDDC